MSPKPLSLRAAALALDVTLSSLQEARDSGRITLVNGKVPDLEALRAEWVANTRDEHAANPLASRGAAAPQLATGETRQEALRREAIARADQREMDRDLQAGKLVLASDVLQEWVKVLTAARTKILGLPSRLRADVPEMGARGFMVATNICRDVLNELADDAEKETPS